jgi:uncharacterized membrane protein
MKVLYIKLVFPILFVVILPPTSLLVWLGLAMVLDLITGIAKAIKKDIPRTSEGLRRTVAKFIQYGGAISIGVILANVSNFKKDSTIEMVYQYFSNSMLTFIIFIELKSIVENMIEVSPESDFTKNFLNPIHKIISIDFKQFFKTEDK